MGARFLIGVSGLGVRDGAVLLLKRAGDRAYWPGERAPVSGLLEAGESPETGLRREVREETWLSITVEPDPIGTWHISKGAFAEDVVGITFVCSYGSARVILSDEHDAHEWVPIACLAAFPVVAAIRPVLERLIALSTIWRGS